MLNTSLKIPFLKTCKNATINENARRLPVLILTLTLINIIRTSPSEAHTLRVWFFQKEFAKVISIVNSKCSWMSNHTTNLTKTLTGRFLECILTKKR